MSVCDQVFISYSHRDRTWLESLRTHLRPLVRDGALDPWDDTRIGPGQEWRAEIDQALARARVAVLLVSPDFLASDFIADVELPAILRAAQRGTLKVIWIPIRASSFSETELGKYQAAWDPAQPLAELKTSARDKALVQIAKSIKDATSQPPPTVAADIVNPFVWRAGITDSDAFFDRQHELGIVRDFLSKRQNVQVVGPRRLGKTSLLLHIQRIAADWETPIAVAYLDSLHPQCASLAGWLRRLARQFAWPDAPGDLEELANRIEEMVKAKTHPVICLDEVEELISRASVFSRDFFLALRSLGQNGLSLITAGRRPLSELMDAADTEVSPFYNTFPLLRLGHFAPVDAHDFVVLARPGVPPFSEAERTAILEFAGGHPLALQAACYWTLNAKVRGNGSVQAAIRAADDDMRGYLPTWRAHTP
jgi:hypothetical protein